jgi:single-strand DNA-binding protein
MSLNKVILQGALGADAEVRAMPNGGSVMNLRLVTNEKWKGKDGEQKERADWHSITQFFKESPRIAQYLTKGKALIVVGKLRNESYEKDGEKKYKTYIQADDITFVSGKTGQGGGGDHAESGAAAPARGNSGGGYGKAGGRGGQQELPLTEEPGAGGFGDDDSLPF